MRKTLTLLTLVLILSIILIPTLCACNSAKSGETGGDKLIVYNWEDYIDYDVLDEFCEYYKEVTGRALSITYTTYDTNETMMTKVLKGDANVDLICPSEYSIQRLLTANCLESEKGLYTELVAEYGEDTFPNLTSIYTYINDKSDENKAACAIEPSVLNKVGDAFSSIVRVDGVTCNMLDYMVPYMWGTLGILYNVNYITEEELDEYGWGVLWNIEQNEKLENMILMKDSVRDSYAAALYYMYEYDLLPEQYKSLSIQELMECTDDEMLDVAEKVLTEQRDHISGYEVDFGKDDMLNEIVYADFAWSGDALWAIEESYDEDTDEYMLDYYVPECCTNVWYDGWAIPSCVNNKLAALMFIDYMCNPMSGARNSMEIGYTSAVNKELLFNDDEVKEFLEENEYDIDEYFEDERRYPNIEDPDTYAKLGVMKDFGDKTEALVQMWQRAKSGSGVEPSLYITLGIIAGIIGLLILVYLISRWVKLIPKKRPHVQTEEKENEAN